MYPGTEIIGLTPCGRATVATLQLNRAGGKKSQVFLVDHPQVEHLLGDAIV